MSFTISKNYIPLQDSLYNADLEKAHLNEVASIKMPHLEKQRMDILSPNFNPKNNWWGSTPTN
jgi:hypothetical protein